MANHNPAAKFNTESSLRANAVRWGKPGAVERMLSVYGSKTYEWCNDCADTHSGERRRAILARLGNVTPVEVYEGLGEQAEHLWGERIRCNRKLLRDLAINRKQFSWMAHQSKPYTAAERELIVSLYRLGSTTGEIGKRLTPRRTHSAIYNFLKKRGFINEHRKTGRNGEAHPWGGRQHDPVGVRADRG